MCPVVNIGELSSARAYLEQGVTLYDPERLRSLTFSRATDLGVVCLSRLSWVLWMLGYPDRALIRAREAIELALKSSHPYSIVFAYFFAAMIHQCRREVQNTQDLSENVMRLSDEHSFILWSAEGRFLHGWTLTQQENISAGIEQMRQSLVSMETMRVEIGLSSLLMMLSEIYEEIGDYNSARHILYQTQMIMQKNEEYYYQSELYRLTGELLLKENGDQYEYQAEEYFQHALDFARRQHAKSLELRVAKSLCRLWQRQGKHVAAHHFLSDIYNWFTEGFDTLDLQEAKQLLDVLSP